MKILYKNNLYPYNWITRKLLKNGLVVNLVKGW